MSFLFHRKRSKKESKRELGSVLSFPRLGSSLSPISRPFPNIDFAPEVSRHGPVSEPIKQILAGLSNSNRSELASTVTELSSMLAMAQESTFPSFVLDKFLDHLINCLNMEEAQEIVCNLL